MQTELGKLVRWIDNKGFGFIKPDNGGKDIFIHISALRGMSRPPVIGDTIHYRAGFDDSGKVRVVHASIEGVSKQLTLEPKARKRESLTASERQRQQPRHKRIRSEKRWSTLPFLLLIFGGIFAYDKSLNRPSQIVDESMLQEVAETEIPEQHFQCHGKVYCSQMTSREEAEFYLDNCPGTKMDGDRDGVPCESQF